MSLFVKQKQTPRHREQIYDDQIGERKKDKLGAWDENAHTSGYIAAKQQGPTAQQKTRCSVITYVCNRLALLYTWN